ncbi:MAG: putative monooxygenase [Steroidobacteraceae bacterium]|nr:putative monooxygenase [Steroidobacteraceae bacterium]
MNTEHPTRKSLRIVVMGAGMAGILAALRLREAGRHTVVVYEKADRIGGTWRENTYPGLACDVPAHAYTYSFAPNAEWSSYLAPGPEIQRYFESIVQSHQLESLIRFGEEITRCEFVDGQWRIETARGTHDRADIVIAATGVLHHPSMPAIAGLDSFAGPHFHSARWDHSVPLDGRRIGVIGCGSTGVQIVSALAGRASNLVHIQRTPQWIMPTPNDPYTEEQKAAFRADPALIDAVRYNEEYTSAVRRFTSAIIDKESPEIHEIEAVVLKNLEDSVRDPVLREKLRPDYRAACKRLIFSSDYYQKVQRPDVEVAIGPIAQIEPAGVRMADGAFHALDILVLATGFRADRFVRPMRVLGRNGADIDAAWTPAPSAYLGITVPGFPNFFMLNGPTGPVGNFSLIDIAERQWGYIEQLIADLESGKGRLVDLKAETMRDYDQRRIAAARGTIFGSGCKSWYLDANGVPSSWPWSYDAFAEQTARPRAGDYEYIH